MKSLFLKTAVTAVLMAATAVAFAAKPDGVGGGGGPPTGHGPPTGEEIGNSLSWPAIMIGGHESITCGAADGEWSDLVSPSGDPQSNYPIDPAAYYYIQGVNKWQAQCVYYALGTQVNVKGAWGDNLSGDAKLKVGSPIRVEIVLEDNTTDAETYQGYTVVKLEPDTLDRLSAYGTLATGDETTGFAATAESFIPKVYDRAGWLTITKDGATEAFVDEAATAEINATGKVVYGYNLRVPETGVWVIEFYMPNVVFDGCDAGTCSDQTATLPITVIGGGGGGGGKKGGN